LRRPGTARAPRAGRRARRRGCRPTLRGFGTPSREAAGQQQRRNPGPRDNMLREERVLWKLKERSRLRLGRSEVKVRGQGRSGCLPAVFETARRSVARSPLTATRPSLASHFAFSARSQLAGPLLPCSAQRAQDGYRPAAAAAVPRLGPADGRTLSHRRRRQRRRPSRRHYRRRQLRCLAAHGSPARRLMQRPTLVRARRPSSPTKPTSRSASHRRSRR
jgi:hypothetical protein